MTTIWDFFAIFGTFEAMSASDKGIVLIIGIAVAFLSGLFTLFVRDEKVEIDDKSFQLLSGSLNTYIFLFPAIILLNSAEIILVMIFSFSQFTFIVAGALAILHIIVKAVTYDPDRHDSSLWGFTALLQKLGHYLIIEKGYHYPLSHLINGAAASNRIHKTQKQYLNGSKSNS